MFAIKSCVQKVRACTRRTAGVLGKLFAEFHCGSLRGVTFCANRKSPKSRTGRGCFDSPSPCEPSPATTEVGLRSPFWNPLGVGAVFDVAAYFSAKISRASKTALISRNSALPWRESKGNRARFLFGGSRVEVFRRRGKRNPRLLNDSLVTFCSHRKLPRGARRQCDTAKRFTQNTSTPRSTPQRSSVKITRPCGKIAV